MKIPWVNRSLERIGRNRVQKKINHITTSAMLFCNEPIITAKRKA